jgi:hypothetical protein
MICQKGSLKEITKETLHNVSIFYRIGSAQFRETDRKGSSHAGSNEN